MCRRFCKVMLEHPIWKLRNCTRANDVKPTESALPAFNVPLRRRGEGLQDLGPGSPGLIEALLRKCHNNLGHPSPAKFVQSLCAAGCHSNILEQANKFRCDVCDEMRKPRARRPAVLTGTPTNGHTIEADNFDWKSPNGRHYKCILAVDRGSRFVHARTTSSFEGGEAAYRERAGISQVDVKRFLSEHWWPWIGKPLRDFRGHYPQRCPLAELPPREGHPSHEGHAELHV